MPTIVYLVHGIGSGTADGQPAAEHWSAAPVEAITWIAKTCGISKPVVLDPIPAKPPVGSDDPSAIWIVPVSYYSVFDDFRKTAPDRRSAMKKLGVAGLLDEQIDQLAGTDFFWVKCLDVLLWWADQAQARPNATALILSALTRADQLAHDVPGANVRRILVSHSLGNAATTYALRHLGSQSDWGAIGAFDLWLSLANVAPFLIEPDGVYAPPLLPGQSGTMVNLMHTVHHEADPVPWLLPWRAWHPDNAAKMWKQSWQAQRTAGRVRIIETKGVKAPANRKPEITDVHGFANYLMAPEVAIRLAAAMRGGAFTDAEKEAFNLSGAWDQLPTLACEQTVDALDQLKKAKDVFAMEPTPIDESLLGAGWFKRLLRAADMLLAASHKC